VTTRSQNQNIIVVVNWDTRLSKEELHKMLGSHLTTFVSVCVDVMGHIITPLWL